MPLQKLKKILSGGQTGADRAALDCAIARGIPYGGWCPQGGWAEDAPDAPGILPQYPLLQETPSRLTEQRTEWNVRDSSATIILTAIGGIDCSPGTMLQRVWADKLNLPLAIIDIQQPHAVEYTRQWLEDNLGAGILNIGGPRESEAPGLYKAIYAFLEKVLA